MDKTITEDVDEAIDPQTASLLSDEEEGEKTSTRKKKVKALDYSDDENETIADENKENARCESDSEELDQEAVDDEEEDVERYVYDSDENEVKHSDTFTCFLHSITNHFSFSADRCETRQERGETEGIRVL